MSIALAIADLKSSLTDLSWISTVHEVERDPGGNYSVYLLPNSSLVSRNVSQIKGHVYGLTLRLTIAGKTATASNVFAKMDALEAAIETDPRRDGNAQTTSIGEEWEQIETENGFMNFEIPVFLQINS